MRNQTIFLKNLNQHTLKLDVNRMAIYKQSKVIEATDLQQQRYYLFFHNDKYLTYDSSRTTRKTSHLRKAFQYGLVLSSPHPFIELQISPYSQFKKRKYSSLFQKLLNEYTLQETALITTYFESFIKKEKLANFIEKCFYKERRDGKLLSCYRIFRILRGFAPNHRLVDTFSSDLTFAKYEELYKHKDEKMLMKDPIYVEEICYDHKYEDFQKLAHIYKQQERWMDLAAIHISQAVYTQRNADYQELKATLDQHYPAISLIEVLEDLYTRGLTLDTFLKDLLNVYLSTKNVQKLMVLQSKHSLSLEPTQSKSLVNTIEQITVNPVSLNSKELQQLILTLHTIDRKQADRMLHQAICRLLSELPLPDILKWLEPFMTKPFAKRIINLVHEINELAEDPNQQRRLGELYHYFKQQELAIECMSWDMELYPDDPKPVEWLSILYSELGMEAEHKAYQQLYIDMVKRSS
ncbi:hypothetical protein RVS70_03365 [Virgibacillus sp. M23]|uniref:hypothetical protein n=1 Tax=Virgibacillus sp. M23 TaxID=3079030 RepID=UPI002A909134|nr:hypothetical protein [Virgibacillus sp. M23]MDY7043237.1 hypothetical protein [Virgibacillus sp. M23]